MTVEDELLPTKDGYDRWAEIYDEEANPLVMIEEPEVAAALGDVTGLAILDVGCGTGRHAVRLARSGARVFPASVPNQISDYVMGALEAGLRIKHLSEHSAGEDLVARAPRAEKYLGWPMLFLMTATPAAS